MRKMTALAIAVAALVALEAPRQLRGGFASAWAGFENPEVDASIDTTAEADAAMHPVGKLVFRLRLATPGAPGDIWMMNATGSNPTRVTCSDPRLIATAPAWSPNGQTIAFYSAEVVGGPQFIYLIDVTEDCGPGILVTAGRFPRWSPDGHKIAFDRGNGPNTHDIFVMDLADGTEVNLTNDAIGSHRADWSPDGKKIVFARGGGETGSDIYVMNADGSNMVQLTFHPATDNAPKWSPDGKKIVFQSDRDGNNEIYVMDVDGSNQTQLTFRGGQNATPDWSPNGQQIVFHGTTAGSILQLFIMNADGTDVTQVTNLPNFTSFPDWTGGHVKPQDPPSSAGR